ncbi:MAG: ABC transporter ATP-binding protein [Acidobacteriota bacterium]
MTAFRLEGVRKSYRHFRLDDLDLTLPEGSIMGFIGPNGAGKSTTIRILMGLVRPDGGRVEVLGRPIPGEGAAARGEVGFVSEDMRLYAGASVRWHMDLVRSFYPTWDEEHARGLLDRFGLVPEQRARGLSHGQRVKTLLLLALARRPRLLVLDEPTTGLDPVVRHEVLEELGTVLHDGGRSVFFSSHNTGDVERLSDRITFIDRGRILETGRKATFLERWRRLRFELDGDVPAALTDGCATVRSEGSRRELITAEDSPELRAALLAAGARDLRAGPLTLEEIFLARVRTGTPRGTR